MRDVVLAASVTGETYEDCNVKLSGVDGVTIRNCTFNRSNVKALRCKNIRIVNCDFVASCGGSGHAVQFDKCRGGYIGSNYFEEPIGQSQLSDVISIFKSNGTRQSPIVIERNYLIGGGPHASGGGIMLGDNMGDWQVARYNTCIDCGQYGIAIAGGASNAIRSNVVMSKQYPWTNVGIYVWGIPQRRSLVFGAVVENNVVSWINRDGKMNSWWLGSDTFDTVQKNNTFNATYAVAAKAADVGVQPQ